MKLSATSRQNGNGHKGRTRSDDGDARYAAALSLVQAIDKDLQRGTRHYYNATGKLLVSLDEVIQAILTDELVIDRPVTKARSQEAVEWTPVADLSTVAHIAA